MNTDNYLEELGGQIRDKHARAFITDEIRCHIDDQRDSFEKEGMSHDEAEAEAVMQMGDPVSVGAELDRIHRPHMEWKFMLYVLFIAAFNLFVQYIINSKMPLDASYGIGGMGYLSTQAVYTIVGIIAMLLVYRADYTILAGRSRMIGGLYLISVSLLGFFGGSMVNGTIAWISIGNVSISLFALFVIYLPVFAGILYDNRRRGKMGIASIFLWMLAPIAVQALVGYISVPVSAFILISELLLFIFALEKDWYRVNKKAVILGCVLIFAAMLLISALRIYNFNGYQSARIDNWLAGLGVREYAPDADRTVNYVNSRLRAVFDSSNLISGSGEAIASMKVVPQYRSGLILGSVSATCGYLTVWAIIIALGVLMVYMFMISSRQKNSLGYIVGCACAVAIELQSLGNILIVFGLLPLTDSVLPFFASGLSFTVANYCLLGLVLSIYRYKDIRREKGVSAIGFYCE